jgi:hypothetical protein
MFSRGFVTTALLIIVALLSLAVARRLEREYRLLRKVRARAAQPGLRTGELNEEERETALDLQSQGVLREHSGHYELDAAAYAAFRGERLRLALGGGLGAVLLAIAIAFVLLRR